jgi:hypothetical protein
MNKEDNIIEVPVKILRIDDTDIFLQNYGLGEGKITVSNTWGRNYSYYWGAMGGTLEEFLCRINEDYFAQNLFGPKTSSIVDAKRTVTAIRKHIRSEIGLKWYEHQEFQKHMREILNSFQRQIEESPNADYFVNVFDSGFLNRLDFGLIEASHRAKNMEEDFRSSMSECWYFIVETDSEEYKWVKALHGEIKKALS